MKIFKIPSPTRLLFGAALAYWLSGIVHPAFVAIAVMVLLFIPVFYPDYVRGYQLEDQPPPPAKKQAAQPVATPAPKEPRSSLLKEETKMLNSPPVDKKKARH